ncbi:hypothetical protein PV10_08389 [Exophiala mesophila]|uniref:Uncharacterized protein n=1 Tax=Exophiala mesophila TaxID=212818 RepID=A0A0D1Z1U1_EXOME|nr:uncharacterized protein PV10_08389 [Exophiala mesophila]KIV88737.1 hypothetical protein PV10_08389 [Exophiala mesophila]
MTALSIASQGTKGQPSKAGSGRPISSARTSNMSMLSSNSSRFKSRIPRPTSQVIDQNHTSSTGAPSRPRSENATNKSSLRNPSPVTSNQVKSAAHDRRISPDCPKSTSQVSRFPPPSSKAEASNRSHAPSQTNGTIRSYSTKHLKIPTPMGTSSIATTSLPPPKVKEVPIPGSSQHLNNGGKSPHSVGTHQLKSETEKSQQNATVEEAGEVTDSQQEQEVPPSGAAKSKDSAVKDKAGGSKRSKKKSRVSKRTIKMLRWFAYT